MLVSEDGKIRLQMTAEKGFEGTISSSNEVYSTIDTGVIVSGAKLVENDNNITAMMYSNDNHIKV